MKKIDQDSLGLYLRSLKLPAFVEHFEAVADRVESDGL